MSNLGVFGVSFTEFELDFGAGEGAGIALKSGLRLIADSICRNNLSHPQKAPAISVCYRPVFRPATGAREASLSPFHGFAQWPPVRVTAITSRALWLTRA